MFLEEHRTDDDQARQHKAGGFSDGVEAQNLLQVADGHGAVQRQAHAALPPEHAGPADDDDGDSRKLIARSGLGVSLLFLDGVADSGRRRKEAAEAIGEKFGRGNGDAREPGRLARSGTADAMIIGY